jgi:regulator of sigma E protease
LETPNAPERDSNLNPSNNSGPSAMGAWLMRNGITLVMAAVVVVWLYKYFGPEGTLSIVKVAVGLGLVIFVHELGHFLVAKWCDVHVEAFSIGFGPAIPGCSFQRGETLYKIAWFPLGGYVKMVGEGAEEEEHDDDPRSFKNKPVWQRMAIISAGVTMNVLLGAVLFVFVYMAHGAEQLTGTIGRVDTGSPAWQAGVVSGARIVQINDVRNPYWLEDVMPAIMHTRSGGSVLLKFEPPGEKKIISEEIEPRRGKDELKPTLGIMSGSSLRLITKPASIWLPGPYAITSAAAHASPPLEFGDTVVGASDAADPSKVTPLRENGSAELDRLLHLRAGKPILLQVRREGKKKADKLVETTVPAAYYYTLGARMRMGHVVALRRGSPAEQAGIQPRDLPSGVEGDIIKQVEVIAADGKIIRFTNSTGEDKPGPGTTVKELDPLRLPFDLEQWAASRKGEKTVRITVLRAVKHAARAKEVVNLKWDSGWRFEEDVPFSKNSPWSIPGLGLAYHVEAVVDAAAPAASGSAENRLKEGDVIKAVRFETPGQKPEEQEPSKWVDLDYDEWAHFFWLLQEADYKDIGLQIERDGSTQELTVTARPDSTWPRTQRGLRFQADTVLVKAHSFGQAIVMGARYTTNSITQIYQNLLAIVTGRVSVKGVAGPVGIAEIAYSKAADLYSLLLFLGMISVNLAVVNFLPIPILDGGHMVFLLYELVRGKAASEQVRVAATYFGLAVILSLMGFVIYLDVSRHF